MTAPLTTLDLHRAHNDDRWLGYGYLGERRLFTDTPDPELLEAISADERLTIVAATDQRIVNYANEHGWTYDHLFAWLNSKYGRWTADVIFGDRARFDVLWDRARRTYLDTVDINELEDWL